MSRDAPEGRRLRDVLRKRETVLRALGERPARKPALVDRLDVSRSTVDRAIADLDDVGLVDTVDGAYTLSKTGELALRVRDEYVERTDRIGEAEPLLKALDPEAPFDPVILDGANVVLADPRTPEGALATVAAGFDEADSLRGFAPVVKSNYASILREHVAHGLDVEIIVERDVLDSMAAVTKTRPELAELFASESVTVLVTDESLPYALWVTTGEGGSRAGLTVHDAGGVLGVIDNDREVAVEWCRDLYERIRSTSSVLGADDLDVDV